MKNCENNQHYDNNEKDSHRAKLTQKQ